MYASHEVTLPHDKVFALLGMLPDYSLEWAFMFRRLVHFLFPGALSMATWSDTATANISVAELIICKTVELACLDETGRFCWAMFVEVTPYSVVRICFCLAASVNPVHVGDRSAYLPDASWPILTRELDGQEDRGDVHIIATYPVLRSEDGEDLTVVVLWKKVPLNARSLQHTLIWSLGGSYAS